MSPRRTLVPLLTLVTLALAAVPGAVPAAAQDAPGCAAPSAPAEAPAIPGGSEALTGAQPGPAPDPTPIQCWTGSTGNAVIGTRALIVGEQVMTLTDTGDAIAFAPDGSEAWRVSLATEQEALLGGLATDGSLLFVGTPTGLVALSPADGSTVWSFPIDPGPQPLNTGVFSPTVAGPDVLALVYTSSSRAATERALVAIDRQSGQQVWSQPVFADIPAGPLSADDTSVAVAEGDGSLVLREVATGAEQLRVTVETLGAAVQTPIVLTRDDVVAGYTDQTVTARSRSDGSVRWTVTPDSGLVASVTVNGPLAFIYGYTTLYAVDAASGAQTWSAAVQGSPPPFTTYQPIPAVVDGNVIVGTTDVSATAALLAFDAATGAQAWRLDLPSLYGVLFSPVVAGDRIYTPSFSLVDDGGLLAFGRPG